MWLLFSSHSTRCVVGSTLQIQFYRLSLSTVQPEHAEASPVQSEALLAGILAAAKAALPEGLDLLVWGASRLGDQATLRHLLTNGGGTSWTHPMDGEEPCQRGSTCLWAASVSGHREAVKELLESGVDVDGANAVNGTTALFVAAFQGHEGVVEQLLEAGPDVNKACMINGATPLIMAAGKVHEGIVTKLLKAGADVNKASTDGGSTPLHMAAAYGRRGAVQVLLKAGANPNAELDDGRTPLIVAAEWGHNRICSILLKAGANVNHAANDHRTALNIAVTRGRKEAALVLMEHGATCSLAILDPEKLDRLTGWMAEALKDKEKAMEENKRQMERLVQGIPEWCAQAASGQASLSEGQQQGGSNITIDPLQPGNGPSRKRKHAAPAATE